MTFSYHMRCEVQVERASSGHDQCARASKSPDMAYMTPSAKDRVVGKYLGYTWPCPLVIKKLSVEKPCGLQSNESDGSLPHGIQTFTASFFRLIARLCSGFLFFFPPPSTACANTSISFYLEQTIFIKHFPDPATFFFHVL